MEGSFRDHITLGGERGGKGGGNMEIKRDLNLSTLKASFVLSQAYDLGSSPRLSHLKFLICQKTTTHPLTASLGLL